MRVGVILFITVGVAERIFRGFVITEHLPRLMYLAIGSALLLLAILGRRQVVMSALVEWGAPRPLINGAMFTASVLLVVSLLANVVGYVDLSRLLIGGVVDSLAIFLVLFAGLTSISELIEASFNQRFLDRFRSISSNRRKLKRGLRIPLVWLALFLWIWTTARSFGIDDWLIGVLSGVFSAELTVGEVTLSVGSVAVFVLAVWLAVWSSRIVRAVVDQDVLPRMRLPRGVPQTISMSIHYSIMLLGLVLGIGFMGIDLGSLTFIVGALGVGIGFGLQNVVNNFISGLILIFEAPIQIGDAVEVGNLMGRVTQIGIRASTVRTFDGSEVIVPNGDLVSNQVVNWTLSDRRRRLLLSVGVAYETDPEQATAVLGQVLEADDGVLKDPAPIIVFDEFGDSALNFRIMAWIADFDASFTVRHRLNVAINKALGEAGIVIPFPQRDLHVKSVPAGADTAAVRARESKPHSDSIGATD